MFEKYSDKYLDKSVNEAKSVKVGDFIKTEYGYYYKRVAGSVGGREAFVEVMNGKVKKRKTSLHSSTKFEVVPPPNDLHEKLNKKEQNLADLLADDVSDYLGDTMDYDDFSSMDQEEKEDVVNNALGKLSDKYYNDGDFDKDLDKLMNRKYKEVTSYIASQLSEGIEMIEEARGAKSTQFTKPGKDGDIYFSKREGNAIAIRKGDTLQSIYVYDGQPKLGKIHKTDKRWENMGPVSRGLMRDLALKGVGGLYTRDAALGDARILLQFVSDMTESLNEGKMPNKYVGNDEIVYLKTKENSKGATYNLYYKGHDIDAGGRTFGSEKELKDFAADYILSNQLYNKLKHEKPKSLPESVNEATKDPVYKKGQKINYQLYFQGGVGKYADAISKSKDVDTGVIRKRTKNKITGSFKYELTNGLELSADEIVGLAESEVNESSLIPRFCDFVNEEREFGMFNGDMGKPTKLDKEVLDIVIKGLPSKITKNIKEVEGSGAYKSTAISPPTVSNKGQSRGEIEYTTIYIYLDKPMGRNKVEGITVGLRKRTSGPGTGYLYMSIKPDQHHSFGPDAEGAIEFIDDPSYFLKKLYDEKFKNWF